MNLIKLLNPFALMHLFTLSFGGGSQPTSQTSTQANIPTWAEPYAAGILGKAEALTDINQNPYQTYSGQRVADFTPLQQQAFQGIAALQPSAATGAGIDVASNVARQAGQAGGYSPLQAQNLYQAPQLGQQDISYQSTQTGAFNQPGMAASYMSPYMQNVVDIQQREAQRQADVARTQRGAQAAGQGAYGGSRQAIMEAEAARNLATQKGDIQAQGLQSAYQQAQQAYMSDAARQLQAQQANQAAQLQAQGQGLGQLQALNQARLQSAQMGAQYGLQGQQLAEQSRQFGAGLGLQGLQQQLAAAGQLGQLGQQQYAQQMGINTAQQQAGAQQQAINQQRLEQQYQDFLNQQRYPYAQLGFMSDILRGGVPATASAQTVYQAPPSFASQLGSLGQLGIGALMYGK